MLVLTTRTVRNGIAALLPSGSGFCLSLPFLPALPHSRAVLQALKHLWFPHTPDSSMPLFHGPVLTIIHFLLPDTVPDSVGT